MAIIRTLWSARKTLIMILCPLLLLPLPLTYTSKAGRCAYAVSIMAIYWLAEVLPMSVTALLPIVLMPVLGISPSDRVCRTYLQDTSMLFFGGLLVAVAVERWSLHKRIALRVLMLVGSQPKWLLFGFMGTTAFLSMWISNTATTAMMLPIAHAVLCQLEAHRNQRKRNNSLANIKCSKHEDPEQDLQLPERKVAPPSDDNTDVVISCIPEQTNGCAEEQHLAPEVNSIEKEEKMKEDDVYFEKMCKCLTLSIAYAANVGGMATLTGTGPNLVLKGQVDTIFGTENGINFTSWFVFAFPNTLLSLLLSWIWLQICFLRARDLIPCKKPDGPVDDTPAEIIRNEYHKLGPVSFAEKAVLVHFIILVLLWLSRKPDFIPGWASLPFLQTGYVTDAVVAMAIAISLFMFPSRCPSYFGCVVNRSDAGEGPAPALLDWPQVHKHMSWSVVLVIGGGFALADSCKASGLSELIGQSFQSLGEIPHWAVVVIICLMVAVFTEFTGNAATATVFLPIVAEMAVAMEINPLYLMLPVTMTTSFAFMLPVASPPNVIVFAYGRVSVSDMVKAGFIMNVICICVLQLSINTYGSAYFHLDQFPSWANSTNGRTTNPALATKALNATC